MDDRGLKGLFTWTMLNLGLGINFLFGGFFLRPGGTTMTGSNQEASLFTLFSVLGCVFIAVGVLLLLIYAFAWSGNDSHRIH